MRSRALKVARFFSVGLILTYRKFPGFRMAFDSGDIQWDIDPSPFKARVEATNQGVRFDMVAPLVLLKLADE